MPEQAAVRLRDVSKRFGANVIYEGLNLEIRRGEIITIVGGSGTGKSVMLKMMLGLVRPDRGRVYIDGEDVTDFDEAQLLGVRRKVGMVFQGGALFDSMSVFDNVAYALVERGERDLSRIRRRVDEVLDMVGLPGIQALMPSELSGGMKKRVALARAVAIVPETLLYDEPTTGLDPTNVRRISELVVRLRQELGVTSAVVTHDLASAFLVSDRLAMLADRRIIEVATREAFKHSRVPEVQAFLRAMPLAGVAEEGGP